jgi:integrase
VSIWTRPLKSAGFLAFVLGFSPLFAYVCLYQMDTRWTQNTQEMAWIENRTRRAKLSTGKRHWHVLEPGLAVGYRRPERGGAGSWYVRALIGGEHKVAALGTADDAKDVGMNWSQAQAKAREWQTGQQTGQQPTGAPLTVEAAIENYVADLRARKGERPARQVTGRLRKHLPPTLGARLLAELTAADLITWRNGLVGLDGDEDEIRRSRDSANRVLTMVRAAFNHAFNTGRVSDDRVWRKVKAFRDVGQARKVILSEGEIQRLVDACPTGLRELVAAGALTGARLGELTAARVRDFDAGEQILTVRGKTGERPIYLAPAAVTLLRQVASGKLPDDHLLTTEAGTRWTPSLHTRIFAAAVKIAGLDPDTVFYALRHSYISRALKAGVPTKAVADHCGTSIVMLQQFYAKFIESDQRRYAAMAAPAVKISNVGGKVVQLKTS